jgi:hypothetical protein
MPLSDILSDALGGFVEWIIVGLGSLLLLPGKLVATNRQRSKANAEELATIEEELDLHTDGPNVLERHEQRMESIERMQARQERYWTGDENDPSDKGALQELHDIKKIVENEQDQTDGDQ